MTLARVPMFARHYSRHPVHCGDTASLARKSESPRSNKGMDTAEVIPPLLAHSSQAPAPLAD